MKRTNYVPDYPPEYDERTGPWKMEPIKAGWAAFGKDWAVHGTTQDEALAKYWEALERHRAIDARPWPVPAAPEPWEDTMSRAQAFARRVQPRRRRTDRTTP